MSLLQNIPRGQGFSQKGVQPSYMYGCPFLEETQGKITQSLIILWELKHAFWTASFQCLAKSLLAVRGGFACR